MGKKSNIVKPRTCLVCGGDINTTSKGLRKHAVACATFKRLASIIHRSAPEAGA